jgi:hypothetical protein
MTLPNDPFPDKIASVPPTGISQSSASPRIANALSSPRAAAGSGRSPVVTMTVVLCSAVCLFTFENVWIDPRLTRRFNSRLLSLVPVPMSGAWFFALLALFAAIVFAFVCLVALLRDSRQSLRVKLFSAVLVLAAVLLSGKWVVATGGVELREWRQATVQKHSVTLRWVASTTPGARYNIYRGTAKGAHPEKLNKDPVDATSFTDPNVVSGQTYYYVTRAVDPFGHESRDSNETTAKIP